MPFSRNNKRWISFINRYLIKNILMNVTSVAVEETVDVNEALTTLDYIQYCLYFALWATIYAIFIKLEFGTVYLIISMLLGVYFNTGTRKKQPNEASAYSVFNKNCEKIDGTLDAEQMTRQMLYL